MMKTLRKTLLNKNLKIHPKKNLKMLKFLIAKWKNWKTILEVTFKLAFNLSWNHFFGVVDFEDEDDGLHDDYDDDRWEDEDDWDAMDDDYDDYGDYNHKKNYGFLGVKI